MELKDHPWIDDEIEYWVVTTQYGFVWWGTLDTTRNASIARWQRSHYSTHTADAARREWRRVRRAGIMACVKVRLRACLTT